LKRGATVSAIGALLLLVSIAAILFVVSFGDHDQYGRVSVPGEATLELPAGEVIVFYEEARSVGEDSFYVPSFSWQVTSTSDSRPLRLDGDGGVEVASREDHSYTDIERLDIPAEGEYRVNAEPAAGAGPGPALTFGTSGVTPLVVGIVAAGIVLGVVCLVVGLSRPPRPRVLHDP
jgi:hypothetical protein